ncbi:YdbC family protein [Mycoplasmopsis hyopharyngis]|uniref:YdbC family protein n=1 Tax=Mycoplasmopsis hyopharyngis TaxID=29558 RepID=UPI003872D285
MAYKQPEITFSIEKSLGVLSENNNGYTKELNLVSWNGKVAKYDIRDWSSDHKNLSKGITLTKEEMIKLKEILKDLEIE